MRAGAVHPDADEFLTSAFYPVEDVFAMIERGEIRDAKTIIAVQSLRLSGEA